MKKFIMLLIVVLIQVQVSFAQTDTSTTAQVTETERIIDKYSNKFGVLLVSLAENLQVPAEHVYKVLVRQQFAEGLSCVIVFLLLAIVGVPMLVRGINKGVDEEWDDGPYWVFVIVGGLIVSGLIVYAVFGGLSADIVKMVNPEYGAIKDIMELVNGI